MFRPSQLGFLPEIRNDFIFAAIGEQAGLVGTMLVLGLFMLFLWHGLRIAWRAPDRASFLIAFGITFMVTFQAAINVAVVTGLVPPKGIGLPFVSAGGSSLLMFGGAVGILLNVAKHGTQKTPRWKSPRAAKPKPKKSEPMELAVDLNGL